jgi:hypothetical protein
MKKLKKISWSYTHPTYGKLDGDIQIDWNQTLCAILNQIGKVNNHINKPKMIIPEKFRKLFESIVYYNQYADRYQIEYINTDIDYVMVGECKLIIENFNNE